MQYDLPLLEPETSWRKGRAAISVRPNSKALARTGGYLKAYDFTLNPYRGCAFGCNYCYAINFVAQEDLRDTWGDWVEVKSNALLQMSRSRSWQGARIYMSSATDPYQPVEQDLGLTRSLVDLMANPPNQPSLVVQTRSPLVERDFDLLSRFGRVRLNLTVSTDDDAIRRQFEPTCPSIERRLATAEAARRAGIPLAICVSPILPIKDMGAFAQTIRSFGSTLVALDDFNISNSRFASSTTLQALDMAEGMGWGRTQQRQAMAELKSLLPGFTVGSEASLRLSRSHS